MKSKYEQPWRSNVLTIFLDSFSERTFFFAKVWMNFKADKHRPKVTMREAISLEIESVLIFMTLKM